MRSFEHRARSRRSFAVGLLGAAGVVAVASCSDPSDSDAPGTDGAAEGSGATGGGGAQGGAFGGTGSGAAGSAGGQATHDGGKACPWVNPPDDVPDGWQRHPIFECQYPIYYPPTKALLPPGLAWAECPELGPDPFACRELVVDWQTMPGWGLSHSSRGHVEADGTVVLQLLRSHVHPDEAGVAATMGIMGLIVEADGPVRQALWISAQPTFAQTTGSKQLWFAGWGVNGGKSSWSVREYWGNVGFVRTALLAGDDTALMQPVFAEWKANDPLAFFVRPGEKYYARASGKLHVESWDGSEAFSAIYSPAWALNVHWVGDVFVFDGQGVVNQLYSWTPAAGMRTLVGYDEWTEGASNVSTDGVDLVWVHGEDRSSSDDLFQSAELMTAKFTADPAELVPKRVRSYPSGRISGHDGSSVTGCGHAAYLFDGGAGINDNRLLIVRLSDGAAWMLRSADDKSWLWGPTLAMTCDELFVTVGNKGSGNTVRRVRLDSLGPALPPD